MSNGEWVMSTIRPHYNLLAWQEAMNLVDAVYNATKTFPKEELYGLTSQIRRAAVSVPSNLAEGAARTGRKEFAQFLSIARGSLSELETQILIAKRQGYLQNAELLLQLSDKTSRLITGLQKTTTK